MGSLEKDLDQVRRYLEQRRLRIIAFSAILLCWGSFACWL